MNQPAERTFRFTHPDVAGPDQAPGLAATRDGRLAMVQGEASIRQAIFLLLTTIPGERVMRPDYGCDLYRLTFSPNDETTAGLAIHYVRRALELFEPRIEVVRLDAGANPDDPGRLEVALEYRVLATQETGVLAVGVDLTGTG